MEGIESLKVRLSVLTDPRQCKGVRHQLVDVLFIALTGMICGADNAEEMETFGWSHMDWFAEFLELPHGIPSQDTFLRVFALMEPSALRDFFVAWVRTLGEIRSGSHVAIDGKTLRHSYDKASGQRSIHMVSAWLSDAGLVLGQVKTEEKSNEITAIPKLLDMLSLKGGIVTIDAMGCQKEIAQKIVDQGADYVLALKGNHGNLHNDVSDFLNTARNEDFASVPHFFKETVDKGHGRIESRRYFTTSDIGWLGQRQKEWAGLKTVGLVEDERTISGKTTCARRCFMSSLPPNEIEKFARAVRDHWAIENSLHWVLDMIFDEDASRARMKNVAENLAILRHIALNLLKSAPNPTHKKASMAIKRKHCGWDLDYLRTVIGFDG